MTPAEQKKLVKLFRRQLRASELAFNGYARYLRHTPSTTAQRALEQYQRRSEEADALATQIFDALGVTS